MIRVGALLAFTALACAIDSAPTVPLTPELENARLRLERVEDNGVVSERAETELARARAAFDGAVAALNAGTSVEDVGLLAYGVQRELDAASWVATREEGEVDVLARADAQAPPLSSALEAIRAGLESRHVEALRSGGALVVTVGRQLLAGQDLQPMGELLLDRVAAVLSTHPGVEISVLGHTDSGSPEYGQRVSAGRAESAAQYLESRGVARSRMTVRGLGLSEPRVPNTTRAGRRINRRVEVWIRAPTP